jgi:hypothetical protein
LNEFLGTEFAYRLGMDTVLTAIISITLILGAVITMNQAGYAFDLRRKSRRPVDGSGRRQSDPNRSALSTHP